MNRNVEDMLAVVGAMDNAEAARAAAHLGRALKGVQDDLEVREGLLARFVDFFAEPCRYDIEGCQTHMGSPLGDCPVAQAVAVLFDIDHEGEHTDG